MEKSRVYFTKDISPDGLKKVYDALYAYKVDIRNDKNYK